MTLIDNLPKAGKVPVTPGQHPVALKWHQILGGIHGCHQDQPQRLEGLGAKIT